MKFGNQFSRSHQITGLEEEHFPFGKNRNAMKTGTGKKYPAYRYGRLQAEDGEKTTLFCLTKRQKWIVRPLSGMRSLSAGLIFSSRLGQSCH